MLHLGLGLGIGSARPRAFSPAMLFSSGAGGAWYDAGDAATLFADIDGATPASLDGPVARIDDKSGGGNHLVQPALGLRPIWRSDESGARFLDFDGDDDWLRTPLAGVQPIDRISAFAQASWRSADRIFHGSVGVDTGNGMLRQSGASPMLDIYSGAVGPATAAAMLGARAIVVERHFGAESRIAVNDGAYTSGDAGVGAIDSLTVGASGDGTRAAAIRFYGLVQVHRALSDDEILAVRRYLASRAS